MKQVAVVMTLTLSQGPFPPDQKIAGLLILKFHFRNGLNLCLKQFNTKTRSLKHKKREYTILKPGIWTHVINHHIWQEVKSPCTFAFKRAKVYPSATEKYIEIRGKCKECHGHIHIKCDREPEMNSPMMLKCFIKNTDDSLHTGCSKRPMSGNLRVQISKELCEGRMESQVWRASEATKLMDLGDPEPSYLPNLATPAQSKAREKCLRTRRQGSYFVTADVKIQRTSQW